MMMAHKSPPLSSYGRDDVSLALLVGEVRMNQRRRLSHRTSRNYTLQIPRVTQAGALHPEKLISPIWSLPPLSNPFSPTLDRAYGRLPSAYGIELLAKDQRLV